MLFGIPAVAKGLAGATTPVAGDGVNSPQLRVVGRLNVNTATREQLLKVPGLDEAAADAILAARATQPIADLSKLATPLSPEALVHLKTDGDSNFTRILQHPLQRLETLANR
jgi:hypothetical protein